MTSASAEMQLLLTAKDQASRELDNLNKSASGFGKTLGDVGKIAGGFLAANVIAGGVQKLTGFISDSVAAARESMAANAQLEAVLKSTGGAAGVTADAVRDHASALEKLSLFEDEAILGGQSLLLTFTGIGKDVFPQATQTMLDMSQALGQDMKSSAIQLGKALNDPILGITALSRVGVSFTEEQKEQIRTMQEAGDVVGAQTLILAELNKEFGGSAKAASDAAGKNEILKDRMNDLKEEIGFKLIPIQEKLAEIKLKLVSIIAEKVIPAIDSLTKMIGPLVESFISLVTTGFTIDEWNTAILRLPPSLQGVGEAVQELGLFIHRDLIPAFQAVSTFIQENWPAISAVIELGAAIVVARVNEMIDTIRLIVGIGQDVVQFWTAVFKGEWGTAWEEIQSIVDRIVGFVVNRINDLIDVGQKALDVVNSIAGVDIGKAAKGFIGSLSPFQSGTPFVPRDMPAFLHRGEAVIPASMNRGGEAGGLGASVNFFGPVTILAQDRAMAEAGAGNMAFGLEAAIKRRGGG